MTAPFPFASVSPTDLAHARVTWHRLAPTNAKALLDAQPIPDATPDGDTDRARRVKFAIASILLFGVRWRRYAWDAEAGRYVLASGIAVPPYAARTALDAVLAADQRAAAALTQQLARGAVTLDAWLQGMRDIITDSHLFAAALASGGWAQVTDADLQRMAAAVRQQFGYLDGFAADIRRGLPVDGRARTRAALYAQAARGAYEQARGAVMRGLGYTHERNVLHVAEHCAGCLAETARGWVSIGALVPIGQRDCLGNDKCTLDYRRAA